MNNEQREKTVSILRQHGYRCIASEVIVHEAHQPQKDEPHGALKLEWWAGNKGVIILQHANPKDGVQCFADWPLGHTFDELEGALK